jgi:hypothetical protein
MITCNLYLYMKYTQALFEDEDLEMSDARRHWEIATFENLFVARGVLLHAEIV